MKKLTALFLFIFSSAAAFGANALPGSQISYLGYGAREAALGYTGIARMGSLDGTTYNPASQADARRMANSLTIGNIGANPLFGAAAFVLPTDIGVFGINALFGGSSETGSLNSLFGAKLSFAKPITENLFIGTALGFATASSGASNDWALGLDLGVIYSEQGTATGVGLFDPSYGLVLKNLGKWAAISSNDGIPPLAAGVGAAISPLKLGFYKLRLSGDLTIPFNPINVAFGVGMENTFFDIVHARIGYTFSTSNMGLPLVGPLNAGIGLNFKLQVSSNALASNGIRLAGAADKLENSTEIGINYSIQNQDYNGKAEFAHTVNVSIAWGFYDDQKPETVATPEYSAFSPNFEGVKDTIPVKLGIRDNTRVYGWDVRIVNSQGQTVKTFKSVDKLQVKNLTVEKFFGQIVSSKQPVEIPPQVEWNGQDETGKVVPDGTYTAVVRAWDENRNTSETTSSVMTLDTVFPKIKPVPATVIYSPNGDGSKDTLPISIDASDFNNDDKTSVEIRNAAGQPVKTWSFNGQPPARIEWDGKDDSGKPAAEGFYTVTFASADDAGNRTEVKLPSISLVTQFENLTAAAEPSGISPASAVAPGTLVFKQNLSSQKGLENYTLTITDSKNAVVKTFTGSSNMPGQIVWDGRDNSGKTLPDGVYTARMKAVFDSGNMPQGEAVSVVIDTTPPVLSLKTPYASFSPNADGNQDTLPVTQSLQGQETDTAEVKITDRSGTVVYFARMNQAEFNSNYTWNGLDKDLKPLPDGYYTYTVTARDEVGNTASLKIDNIFLKTGLEKVSITADAAAISPGNTNALAQTAFTPALTSKDGITSLVLTIADSSKQVVRTFSTNTAVDKFVWDGRDNSGKIVPDGVYTYAISLKYAFGDEPASQPRKIEVKTKAPVIEVSAPDLYFSPNGDGRKETLDIGLTASPDSRDIYTITVTDAANQIVKNRMTLGRLPDSFSWDGRTDKGADAPEGVYTVTITGTDLAGNKTVKKLQPVVLGRSLATAVLTPKAQNFNPAVTPLTFGTSTTATNYLGKAVIRMTDAQGRTVRELPVDAQNMATTAWDGKDSTGANAPDGIYTAALEYDYLTGNLARSVQSGLILDRTPVDSSWTITPDLFTPDNDGEGDILYQNLELADLSGIANWAISIYKKQDDGKLGRPFKTFGGTNSGKVLLTWDGLSDDKEDMVEAVQDYQAYLNTTDRTGNVQTNQKLIPVGVLVEKTPEGLRIRISSIQFAFNSAELQGNYRQTLDKIITIIRKIVSDKAKYGITDNYRIEVSGHTDDVGAEEYNQKLSERRAKSVYNYLVDKDIDPKILTSVGYGESRQYKEIKPDMPAAKRDEYRARNRRVEFFIRK